MAITVDVGKIKLVWRAVYAGGTAYEVDDVVSHDDGSTNSAYICVANATGQTPSTGGTVNTTYWNLLAKGASATSGGTADGQVQYKDSTGFGGTSLLYYDTTNDRLGIGSTVPTRVLDVVGNVDILGNMNLVGVTTLAGITTVTDTIHLSEITEACVVDSARADEVTNIDAKAGGVYVFTVASNATWTHNIRGDGSTTLNSIMSDGECLTMVIMSKQTNTAYYSSALQIDGTASGVSINWFAGSAPGAGKASSNGYDVYVWNIIKTGSAAYTVLATQSQYGA